MKLEIGLILSTLEHFNVFIFLFFVMVNTEELLFKNLFAKMYNALIKCNQSVTFYKTRHDLFSLLSVRLGI